MPSTESGFAGALVSGQGPVSKRTVPPRFTLSSTTPGNPIIAQRQVQRRFCIPSNLADLRIKDPAVLLAKLNDILGTAYSFQSTPALKDILLDCISRDYDLGMAYGMLRRWWSRISPNLLSHLKLLESKDHERRKAAVVDGLIKDVRMPPRRVWDLHSNRVLPFWAAKLSWGDEDDLVAVSHAWMSPGQRVDKDTPINGHQWPVPIPRDIDLDDLRIELLNLRNNKQTKYTYTWLDVLCLRQKGGPLEKRRAEEWEIDVPTIGSIYQHCSPTVLYLNGLGRPFEENDLDDARHWCNRAWTVQEWCRGERKYSADWNPVLGGIAAHSPRFIISQDLTRSHYGYTKRLEARMNGSEALVARTNIIEAAAMMSKRQAERDLDKLAGLAYLACGETQPVFDPAVHVDDAWLSFIDCMTPEKRGQLFFLFPATGDRDYEWAPSWNQLLSNAEELVADSSYNRFQKDGKMDHKSCPALSITLGEAMSSREHPPLKDTRKNQNDKDGYSCLVICLPDCHLEGFDGESTSADSNAAVRKGTVSFYVPQRDCNTSFELIAHHPHPIPSGRYCLLATRNDHIIDHTGFSARMVSHSLCYWVVGLLDEEERFHKISVLEAARGSVYLYGSYRYRHFKGEKVIEELALYEDDLESNPWVRRVKLA